MLELQNVFFHRQLRAVLHQLLQREVTATVYRVGVETGAGGVRARRHHVDAREYRSVLFVDMDKQVYL